MQKIKIEFPSQAYLYNFIMCEAVWRLDYLFCEKKKTSI